MSKRKIDVTIEVQVTVEIDVGDEWTWDDVWDEAGSKAFSSYGEMPEWTITDAQEVDE